MNNSLQAISTSIEKVERWVEEHGYRGYEPFDGMSSYLTPLALGNLFLERLLMQLIRQSPVNLRPLVGVKPQESTKGRGYMASGYLALYRLTGNPLFRTKAAECLDWLIEHKSPKFEHYSWANHFAFVGRGGKYGKDESIIVWTALIGQVFLDAAELLKDEKYLRVAESICCWILALPRETTSSGTCLSYLMPYQSSIHNSNMLGAAMLARTAAITGNKSTMEVARQAMQYSCSRQQPDGSWFYGEAPKYHWIDNFHTGYNLVSLKQYLAWSQDREYEECLRKGYRFFKDSFFEESGRPKYYHNRTFPVDSQCAAQAIETLVDFADLDPSSLETAVKVATWTIENMQDREGYFYYRQYPLIKAKTPMLHWAQATTFKALSVLLLKLDTIHQQKSDSGNHAGAAPGQVRETA